MRKREGLREFCLLEPYSCLVSLNSIKHQIQVPYLELHLLRFADLSLGSCQPLSINSYLAEF